MEVVRIMKIINIIQDLDRTGQEAARAHVEYHVGLHNHLFHGGPHLSGTEKRMTETLDRVESLRSRLNAAIGEFVNA